MYSQRDHLLQEISDLCTNTPTTSGLKRKRVSKEKQIVELGKQAREQCALANYY